MPIISKNSFDFYPNDIVPVIASFDSEGHIAPLYVRIRGEPYKIASFWVSATFRNAIDFKCKVVDGDCVKPLALTYHVQANMWTIVK